MWLTHLRRQVREQRNRVPHGCRSLGFTPQRRSLSLTQARRRRMPKPDRLLPARAGALSCRQCRQLVGRSRATGGRGQADGAWCWKAPGCPSLLQKTISTVAGRGAFPALWQCPVRRGIAVASETGPFTAVPKPDSTPHDPRSLLDGAVRGEVAAVGTGLSAGTGGWGPLDGAVRVVSAAVGTELSAETGLEVIRWCHAR